MISVSSSKADTALISASLGWYDLYSSIKAGYCASNASPLISPTTSEMSSALVALVETITINTVNIDFSTVDTNLSVNTLHLLKKRITVFNSALR
ncbi:hypothetical protein ALTER154_50178 [Alteromonas sp. 154]|nr:hypothetical protein ALTER154_50178 [Alteromonas sp. 154]